MADTKITALTALTAADPANDVIPIVDVSDTTMAASGTTKKISVNNILGASGTATLASATITGAATVGTTLGVTGASTLASASVTGALGAAGLNVTGATIPANGVYLVTTNKIGFSTNSTQRFTIESYGNLENTTTTTGNGFLQFSNTADGGTLGYFGNSKAFITGGATSSVGIRGESSVQFSIGANLGMTLNSTGLLVGTTSNYTGANIFSSKGLGTANIATDKFATVEYGSGASGVFTTITVSFTVNSANSSVIIEALLSGFSGVYLDHVAGKYGTQAGVVIRNNASVGTTVAALAVDGTGLIYTLTITTAVTHPVIKVKATVGGQGQTTTLPVITFA